VLTREDFDSLSVTDLIETEPLVQGLSDEPVKLRVSQINEDHTRIEFVAMWFGITLGRWVCTATDDKLDWNLA
jgi:hypothetical protein